MTFFARHIRSIPGLFLFSIIVALACTTSSLAESAQGQKQSAKIVSVLHCDYPPVSSWDKNTDRPAGFFVDIMDSVARRAGLQVKYICKDGWPEMINAIESGEADLGVLLKSKEREKRLLFSTPIDITYLSFFVRSQSNVDPDGVPVGYTVGVIKGSMSYEQLKDRPGVILHTEGSYQEGLFCLLAGKISVFAGEESMVLKRAGEARLEDRIKKVGKPFVERERGIAVKKDNVQLLELLNKVLPDFVGSPEYQSIYLKWYGAPVPYWTNKRIFTASGVFLFIVVCGMALWRYLSIARINKELISNITERRRSEEMMLDILDSVDEGFIVVDRDYRILTVNRAYCTQVGLSSSEVEGRHCFEVSHKLNMPCYEAGEECAVRKAFETGKPFAAYHKHYDADSNTLYVETKAFPLKDASGSVTTVIESISNITEKHLLEEERLKMQKLEAIGTLAGGIAHDFNNLLQGVFGYISLAKLTVDREKECITALEQAEKALHMSVRLTNQLLTFSKGGKPVKNSLSLRPVIENATKFALSGSRSDNSIIVDEGLWQAEADEGQIGQVIQNIVLNADQAMPEGGSVEIKAGNVHVPDDGLLQGLQKGRYVQISIRDSGIGIPEQYVNKVFDPYFTTKEKGSGLGLATSYSIIKNHGGLIDVKSTVGKGTTFFVYLPAVSAGQEAEPLPLPEETSPARKGKVLLMDDEQVIRDVAGELIKTLGHEVEFAGHGEEAIEKYIKAKQSGKPFDVVILDLTIRGGMGGAETVRKLLESDPGVKAIVSSGYSDNALLSQYGKHGFVASLKKPYSIEGLRDRLNEVLK